MSMTPEEVWQNAGLTMKDFTPENEIALTPIMDHIQRWDRLKKRGPWFNRRPAGYLIIYVAERVLKS